MCQRWRHFMVDSLAKGIQMVHSISYVPAFPAISDIFTGPAISQITSARAQSCCISSLLPTADQPQQLNI